MNKLVDVLGAVKSLFRAFGLVAACLGVSLFAAAAAQAQEVDGLVCTMSGYLTFESPLTKRKEERNVAGEASISTCVDKNGPVEGIEAEVLFSGDGVASCTLQSFTISQAVIWNDGQLDFSSLEAPDGGPAPLGAYKGVVDFGKNEGSKVITVLFNDEPLQTLSCVLGIDPIGTYNFSGVQIFTDLDTEAPGTEL
ncbi:hypothetical protein [Microbulbifer litoralis]|uniref:hypothetical protein n=1 Tax=Microbulbifer litoralis TaxID=2933965 RepID=UPI002028EDAA|nr:hypothetical protein [Microbulbifer sp. GX H0434]